MQEQTQKYLDDYNTLYNWEYNDMVDFIKSYGEEAFREYYDDYHGQVDELGIEPVEAFIEVFSIDDVANVVDSYQGSYYSGADFAEQLCKDCGYTSNDMPHWIEIDWRRLGIMLYPMTIMSMMVTFLVLTGDSLISVTSSLPFYLVGIIISTYKTIPKHYEIKGRPNCTGHSILH